MSDKLKQSLKISSNIKRLRDKNGWTQARLAKEAGVTAAALSKIETGDGRIPTIVVLRKLASALGVSAAEISGEESFASTPTEKTAEFFRMWGDIEDIPATDQETMRVLLAQFKKRKDT